MEVLDAVGPLNRVLCDLHGPTANVGFTMSGLVPFPADIASLPDADLLDLKVLVEAGSATAHRSNSTINAINATVKATARYATSARVAQVREFYLDEFARAGAVVSVAPSGYGTNSVLLATLADESQTTYSLAVDEFRGYRAVKVTVRYDNFDASDLFARFAGWHNGSAPVSAINKPTGLEISTFASGRRPSTLVLYSTEYECTLTSEKVRRAMVDRRIHEQGWTYREPREGIMFIQDGKFDAETHVVGNSHSSNVTFVGEFQLR